MSDEAELFEGRYQKVTDGRGGYARVTIRADYEKEGGGLGIECEAPESWKVAAVMGVGYALRQMECDYMHFTVVSISGTACDTNPTIVLTAAARAVWAWRYQDSEDEDCDAESDAYLVGLVADSRVRGLDSIPILHH